MLKRMGQALGLAGIAAFAMSTPALAAEPMAQAVSTLEVEDSDEYGEYLVTDEGRAVYVFEADSQGESACYDDCAAAWPPLTPMEGTPSGGDNVDEDMIGTIDREDGVEQVTYGGQPLYAFVRDTDSGDVTGHGVEGFGGEWYLVGPDGETVSMDGEMESSEDSSDAVGTGGSGEGSDGGADSTNGDGGTDGGTEGDATDGGDGGATTGGGGTDGGTDGGM